MLAAALALALAAAPNPDLSAAQQQIAALAYDKAEASLAKALAAPGLDLATRLQALKLQGEVEAFVNKPDAATRAFEELLYLAPTTAPDPAWSPKVSDRFKEAQAADQKTAPLALEAAAPVVEAGRVKGVAVRVQDPRKLVQAVRITSGGTSQVVPVSADGLAVAPVSPAPQVAYWVEGLGASQGVLTTAGSAEKPLHADAPPEVVAAAPGSGRPGLRTAGYITGGAGVAALAASAVFASMASSDRSTLRDVTRDAQGRITGLSQADYQSLYDRANSRATTAVILGGVGAAAIAGGAALWIAGRSVTVTPTANGAAVVGSLP